MPKKSESSSGGDSLNTTMTSLKVAVRVRPLNDKEINLGSKIVVDVHGNETVITDLKVPEHNGYDNRSRVHRFSFDYGFSSVDPLSEQYSTQTTVFENFGRVVLQALLEGYNCCVIAYGQSGSGKTYTMMGMKDEEGLTPRICEGLLTKLENEAKQNIAFAVNISYMEIYNEQVYDLLQKPNERQSYNKPSLRVREHPIHGPFVEGLSTHVLKSRDNIYQLISAGNDNRVKATTDVHERSSRSHAIFTLHCSQACLDKSQPKEVVSKLQLVDLAGSEKAGEEFCYSRLKEGANINKSLVTLGKVISALVELSQRLQNNSKGCKQLFVPYRDSQLTWLMKDSLGGNSHTFMLAAVSPSQECYSETLSTLRYAQRAKNVLNVPVVNEDSAAKTILNLRLEVNKLKSFLINADILKKNTNHLNTEASNIKEGIAQDENTASESFTEEKSTTSVHNWNNELNIKTNPSVSLLSMKSKEGSDIFISDKSSTVSSECILLPNEVVFYSKRKRNNTNQANFNESKGHLKSSSMNYVDDAGHKIFRSVDTVAKTSSTPTIQFHSNFKNGIFLLSSICNSLPLLNNVPVSNINVHNPLFSHGQFSSFSVPKDFQILPDNIVTAVDPEKEGLHFEESHEETCKKINCFEQMVGCEDEVCDKVSTVSICERNAEVKNNLSNGEFSLNENSNDSCKNGINIPFQTDKNTSCVNIDTHDISCTNSLSTLDNSMKCKMITNGEIYDSGEIQFNDNVAEESNNFVKLLNQIQDDSMEPINTCFPKTDFEILSLLSLSSNDHPPFQSLDDIYDVMEVSSETSSINMDTFPESEEPYSRSISPMSSTSNVIEMSESESSDAESEFDYLDFTKNMSENGSNLFPNILNNEHQTSSLDSKSSVREHNSCVREGFLKNVPSPQRSMNSDAPVSVLFQAYNQVENETTNIFKQETPATSSESFQQNVSFPVRNFSGKLQVKIPEESNYLNLLHNNAHGFSNIKEEEKYTSCLQGKKTSLQKRLCASDSLLRALPNSEVKNYSKSDNPIFLAPEECVTHQKFGEGNEGSKTDILHTSKATYNKHDETIVLKTSETSDLLDFSMQDIFNAINDKGGVLCNKHILTHSEEGRCADDGIPEEIQRFIDNTEITDANKLAGELHILRKQLSQCPSLVACTFAGTDTVLNDQDDQNKPQPESTCCVYESSSEHSKKKSDQDLEGSKCEVDYGKSCSTHCQEQTLPSMEKGAFDVEQGHNITVYTKPSGAVAYKLDEIEDIECIEKSEKFQADCDNKSATGFAVFNEHKHYLSDTKLDENDGAASVGSSMCEAKTSSNVQQTYACNDSQQSEPKAILSLKPPVEQGSALCRSSHFHDFASAYPSVYDSNSQSNTYGDFGAFDHLNITSLAPIQEVADDDMSDVSEDDSPNISFQFDSLERPKCTSSIKNCSTGVDSVSTVNAPTDENVNAEEAPEFQKLDCAVHDTPKSVCNIDSDSFSGACIETTDKDRNMKLLDLELSYDENMKISNETVKSGSVKNFPVPLECEGTSSKSSGETIHEETNSLHILDTDDIDENVEFLKSSEDLKYFEDINNLPNQLCCWDSSSSTTSSDSITFVFVGKESQGTAIDANSRSFHSSLFSSVSLDSLEKSSVHQNQVACISPRTLSIDSLVAEELLYQLRNSDTATRPVSCQSKKHVTDNNEITNTTFKEQELVPIKTTSFAASLQRNSNEHLKMNRFAQHSMENKNFLQGTVMERLEIEKHECQNERHSYQEIPISPANFSSESYCEKTDYNQFQNVSEHFSSICMKANGYISAEMCNYSQTETSEKHSYDKNAHYNTSNDLCNAKDSNVARKEDNILEESDFETSFSNYAMVPHYISGSYQSNFPNNNNGVTLSNFTTTEISKSLECLITNDNIKAPGETLVSNSNYSSEESFCGKYVKNDLDDELFAVKELTEENLKIFNSEFEENQDDNFILPPPSSFDVSEDLLTMPDSSCSSLPCKLTESVLSKGTQTDHTSLMQYDKTDESDKTPDTENTDLILRMMDLMVETMKLVKEQYRRTSKKPEYMPKRKLHFLGDSDEKMASQKQIAIAQPASCKDEKHYSRGNRVGSRVAKYLNSVLPSSDENDCSEGNANLPLPHSERLLHPRKNVEENSVTVVNKERISHGSRTSHSAAKNPNFYTLPFDFITRKSQSKKSSDACKLGNAGALSQTSIDYLLDQVRNPNFKEKHLNDLLTFNSQGDAQDRLSDSREVSEPPRSYSRQRSSKSRLKHLIEVRRKVVEATMNSVHDNDNKNSENQAVDPLKSSSSSEGYLSSVSSRGPIRQLSETSTDSQESNQCTQHLLTKRSLPRKNVRALDLSRQGYKTVASPDTRWLNASADSGAFCLDSPGNEKKVNPDEYSSITPKSNDCSSLMPSLVPCSSKRRETEYSHLPDSDISKDLIKQKEKSFASSKIKQHREHSHNSGHKRVHNHILGSDEFDEICETDLNTSFRKFTSVKSSSSSDFSFDDRRPSWNKSASFSRTQENTHNVNPLSSQEIRKLLESIEADKRLLGEIQRSHVFGRKYCPSFIFQSPNSTGSTDDLCYEEDNKSLPSPHLYSNSSVSHTAESIDDLFLEDEYMSLPNPRIYIRAISPFNIS